MDDINLREAKLKERHIRKFDLEEEPLLTMQVAFGKVWLHRQKHSSIIYWLNTDRSGSGVTLLDPEAGENGRWWGGSKSREQQTIYGYLPAEAVSVTVKPDERTEVVVDSTHGVFLAGALSVPVMLTFHDHRGHVVRQFEVPEWWQQQRPNLFVRLLDWVYSRLSLARSPAQSVPLSKKWYG